MIIDVTNETWEDEVINSTRPVVVDFWAPWCGPCKTMSPIFEAAANEVSDVKFVKVNIDETDIAPQYAVRGIPTLLLFNAGKVTERLTGAQGHAAVVAFAST